MAQLIREKDWSRTALGPMEGWSVSLRMMVSFLLANRFPLLLWWGPDYISIYNDAYRPVLGSKHPGALGQPLRECWAEIRHVIEPLIDAPFNGGPATWMEDIPLEVNRHGFLEETHFTIAYSPVPDDTAPRGIGGVLATVHEITEKIIGERRLAALRDLGARSAEAKTAEEACAIAAAVLGGHDRDIPFALLYLVDPSGKSAKLAGASGVGELCTPRVIALDRLHEDEPWPLARALAYDAPITVENLVRRPGAAPTGPCAEPARTAVVVPIRSTMAHRVAGFLVAGVSPRLSLDDLYRTFLDLTAAQIATAIAHARAYEDERRRAEALAEIDRAKTIFFSNVSHEFRTPLSLMLGPIDEAIRAAGTPAAVRAQLEVAQRNSLRLLKLVNSLLDFSRIEAGRAQASYEATDLAALTRDLASTFGSTMERAGLRFVVECAPLDEPVYVDREMWEKIVLNLISNAFKFTHHGAVTVRLRRDATEAVLEVADTGVGMPEHELPRLFERFHRVEGTVGRTQEGSGIGLALVQELIKLHEGRISATSKAGHGTTFFVRLPFGVAHLPEERIKAPRTRDSTALGARPFVEEALRWIPEAEGETFRMPALIDALPASPRRGEKTAGARIVLADDNADMRAYIRDLLSPVYLVEAVADGEQALAAARRERPDLILSDIMMPRVDGLGLLVAVRADAHLRDVPVILLSARAGEEARIEGLDAGADDYLIKPFYARELMSRVGALLELTEMRRDNEERFRAFVSATSDAVFRMSPDWGEMRFLRGRDFIADTDAPSRAWLDEYIPADAQPAMWEAIREALRAESVFQLEHRVRRVDGSIGWALSRAVPIKDRDGAIVEWFGAASDVTERKRAEQSLREREQALAESNRKLRASEDALREADQRKNEFIALLGHELRNPLAPISAAGELLARTSANDADARSAIDIIRRQAAQLTRLMDDLLDIGRITQGRLQLQRKPLELASVIAQAIETAEPHLRQKGHNLSVTGGDEPIHVLGDFARLVQCVANILTNAAKYTDANGHVGVDLRSEGSTAVIEISDDGAGISAELLPRVFELFVQCDRTLDRAEGGLGIGLSLVKRLVEMHGGEVTARSPGAGRGSAFEIRLPRIAVSTLAATEERPLRCASRRVLVVDDNVDAANSLAMLLSLAGHETAVAHSAAGALDRIEQFRPDVAVLDIGLPEMSGYELAQRLRAIPRLAGTRLVALTGYGQPEDHERTRAAGFDDHLVKPVDLAALERLLALEGCANSGADPAASRPARSSLSSS